VWKRSLRSLMPSPSRSVEGPELSAVDERVETLLAVGQQMATSMISSQRVFHTERQSAACRSSARRRRDQIP